MTKGQEFCHEGMMEMAYHQTEMQAAKSMRSVLHQPWLEAPHQSPGGASSRVRGRKPMKARVIEGRVSMRGRWQPPLSVALWGKPVDAAALLLAR